MLGDAPAFGSFSTNDVAAAKDFYGRVLGLSIADESEGGISPMFMIAHANGQRTLVYGKDDHVPATHTVLNFEVEDLDAVAAALKEAGVALERLEWTDEDGIARDPEHPDSATAWFKDPAGNWILIGQNMQG